MATTLSDLYKSKALVLARTSVIKLNRIALMINDDLVSRGYVVDPNNPTTWKYYLNLNGQYHQADKDALLAATSNTYQYMRVTVAGNDVAQEVDFTKDLFFGDNADLAVANEYRFNTQYYNELVTKYPDFELLILGILNPIPLSISTTADEGEILYCGGYLKTLLPSGRYHMVRQDYGPIEDNYLIETNEENLIPILQSYVNGFITRYLNVGYHATHNLFYVKFILDLYMFMALWIYNIRLSNVKSPRGFTHSFHVKQYLDARGNLGWVTDHIALEQSLWLYRNMDWLYANRGKSMAFKAIVDNILTPSDIPLSGYLLRHDNSGITESSGYFPKAFLQREVINISHTGSGGDYNEIKDIVAKEVNLAVENDYDTPGQTLQIGNRSRYSMFDNLNTKLLESKVIDTSNDIPFTQEDVGLNLWLFTAAHGFYTGTVFITNPATNDRVQLTPLNAYILAIYCFNKGYIDYEMTTIPELRARLIQRVSNKPISTLPDVPTFDQLKSGVLTDNISDDKITEIVGSFVPDFIHASATTLATEINKEHVELMRRYYAYCQIQDPMGRAMGEWVAHQCYWNEVPCELAVTGTTYSQWLITHGLDLSSFTRENYIDFAVNIVEAATQLNTLKTEEISNKQRACLAILKHFASYTVQVIQTVVAADSYLTGNKFIRLGGFKSKADNSINVDVVNNRPDVGISMSNTGYDLMDLTPSNVNMTKDKFGYEFDVRSHAGLQSFQHAYSERVNLFKFSVDVIANDVTETITYSSLTSMTYPLPNIAPVSVNYQVSNPVRHNPYLKYDDGATPLAITYAVADPIHVTPVVKTDLGYNSYGNQNSPTTPDVFPLGVTFAVSNPVRRFPLDYVHYGVDPITVTMAVGSPFQYGPAAPATNLTGSYSSSAIQITTTMNSSYMVGTAIDLAINVIANTPATVSSLDIIAGALPAGISINGTHLSGTFATAGDYNFTLQATTDQGIATLTYIVFVTTS